MLKPTRTLTPVLVAGTLLLGGTAAHAEAGKTWQQDSVERLSGQTALERSQGVATDGNSWFFSWQQGLSRANLDGTVAARNPMAIPPELAAQGSNHIGDLDYHDGRLYVAIEDDGYKRPTIAVFDADTLTYTGISQVVPTTMQTHIPWVAIDAERGLVYSSDFDPVSTINVFSLSDLRPLRTVSLNQTIGHVQGAKVYEGALYASTDDETKSVYRIDPTTGAVSTELKRNELPTGTEGEGLAFLPTAGGAVMHIIDVAPNLRAVNVRHYRPVK
jgi:outer membrane protein assembly factor BamB